MEFFASVASLMARTAWWAGKGNWRDSEMSFNGTPFEEEWMKIQSVIEKVNADNWFADISFNGTMFNRDHVYYPGIKWDSPDYWERNSTDPEPIAEIPI
jgi:hypothetical protein